MQRPGFTFDLRPKRAMGARTAALLVLALVVGGCARHKPRVSATVPRSVPAETKPEAVARSDSARPTPPLAGNPAVAGGAPSRDRTLDYLRSRELMVPVEGVRVGDVTDTFSQRRGDRQHNAHDIMAPRGTPVLSADDGRIIRLSNNSLGGITIYATDPDEQLVYYYAHLDRYADGLRAGAKLAKGQLIGYVGSTGNASPGAPHLHFQVARMKDISRHWEGVPLDARGYFAEDGKRR